MISVSAISHPRKPTSAISRQRNKWYFDNPGPESNNALRRTFLSQDTFSTGFEAQRLVKTTRFMQVLLVQNIQAHSECQAGLSDSLP